MFGVYGFVFGVQGVLMVPGFLIILMTGAHDLGFRYVFFVNSDLTFLSCCLLV